MPTIYLSPSTQEFNQYADGGNEEYYMNLIADAMLPYLQASGITVIRNTPDMTAASSIAASNAADVDFHLALHSNAAAGENAGNIRGSEVYYAPSSQNGKRAAEIFANNLKWIYPIPERVRTVSTTSLGEVNKTRAPAVLIEYAYHDNPEDAQWIRQNIVEIAENTVLSLTDYFGIPFNLPEQIGEAVVSTPGGGNLNLRDHPNTSARIITAIPNGTTVQIYARLPEWDLVSFGNWMGYVYSPYLTVLS